MKVIVNGIEIQRFGERFARRPVESTEDFEVVDSLDDEELLELRVGERMYEARLASGPRMRSSVITRSERNKALAAELGLDADQLAERLQTSGRYASTQGTETRVSEERFDAIAGELGLDPQNMRDRFAGRVA